MLSRRWLINCALIVVIAALAWAGLRFDTGPEEKSSPRISSLKVEEINQVELQLDELKLRLQRVDNGWRITAPIDWPADAANVERLLSILKLESSALAELADVDPQALGLQPPKASLRLNDTILLFGATNNIGGRRYLLIESSLYLLPDVHLAFAAQGLLGVVDRRLLPEPFDITALRLPGLELRLDSGGQWQSSGEAATPQEQLELLVDNWQALPAGRIHPFDPDSDTGELIEARFADGQHIEFRLLATKPEIIIANPRIGLKYHFRASFYDQLVAPPDADG